MLNLSVSYFADIILYIGDCDNDFGCGHDSDCDRYDLSFAVGIAASTEVVITIANVQDDVREIWNGLIQHCTDEEWCCNLLVFSIIPFFLVAASCCRRTKIRKSMTQHHIATINTTAIDSVPFLLYNDTVHFHPYMSLDKANWMKLISENEREVERGKFNWILENQQRDNQQWYDPQ